MTFWSAFLATINQVPALFSQHALETMIVVVTYGSFALSRIDLRNKYVSTFLNMPLTTFAAWAIRAAFFLGLYVIVRKVGLLGNELGDNLIFLVLAYSLFGVEFYSSGELRIAFISAYEFAVRRIAWAEGTSSFAYPTMLDIVMRSNPTRALQERAEEIVAGFRNAGMRAAFEREITEKRVYESRAETYAHFLLRARSWSQLHREGFVPDEYADKKYVFELEKLVKRAAERSTALDITDESFDLYLDSARERSTNLRSPVQNSRKRLLFGKGWRESQVRDLLHMVGPDRLVPTIEAMPKAIALMKEAHNASLKVDLIPLFVRRTKSTVRLLGLELKNIRCFDKAQFDFSERSGGRSWSLLLGDNGLGKSTVLKCISIGLCDIATASALMKAMPGTLLREGSEFGSICLSFKFDDDESMERFVTINLSRTVDGDVELSHEQDSWLPRDRVFVCGYGAMRSGFGTRSFEKYDINDAVRSLFDASSPLQNPELILRRMGDSGHDMNRLRRRLEQVLLVEEGSVKISSSGISIKGPWGNFVPAGAIGDGYHATLAWIADFLGWAFSFDPDSRGGEITGIVLIDELEKHLHPRWQREVIEQLYRQFPKVQFIATTHSPICAGGLADLPEGEGLMYHLQPDENGSVQIEPIAPLAGWSYDQIILSDAFSLRSSRDKSTEEIIDSLQRAIEDGDQGRVAALRAMLAQRPPAAEEEKDREIRERLLKIYDELSRAEEASS